MWDLHELVTYIDIIINSYGGKSALTLGTYLYHSSFRKDWGFEKCIVGKVNTEKRETIKHHVNENNTS